VGVLRESDAYGFTINELAPRRDERSPHGFKGGRDGYVSALFEIAHRARRNLGRVRKIGLRPA
jgi:hypothetical protein